MKNLTCPCCKSNKNVLLQEHWTKKHFDFICGNCKLELQIPKVKGNIQDIINNIFDFEHLEPIRERISNMTQEEMLQRLKELEEKD